MLQGRVDAIAAADHPGLVLVRVRIGAVMLVARLTRRAVAGLGIVPEQDLWVQVKSVALME